MRQTVYKYPFQVAGVIEIDMPAGAQILTVQVQHGTPCMWALVNPDAPMEKKRFFIYGTGHAVDQEGIAYIGTIQLNGFVWHVFF